MFLSAGSVMHGMNDEVDMRRYGGLWRTSCRSPSGCFICGLPGDHRLPGAFTGFFTKDKIIEIAFDKGGTSGYVLGLMRADRGRPDSRRST